MKITVPCENCGKKLTIDTAKLPPMNSIALKASKGGTREVYVDCPKCGGETAAEVPIESAKMPTAQKPAKKKK
jgi:uncharacterized Zn finger protein